MLRQESSHLKDKKFREILKGSKFFAIPLFHIYQETTFERQKLRSILKEPTLSHIQQETILLKDKSPDQYSQYTLVC